MKVIATSKFRNKETIIIECDTAQYFEDKRILSMYKRILSKDSERSLIRNDICIDDDEWLRISYIDNLGIEHIIKRG